MYSRSCASAKVYDRLNLHLSIILIVTVADRDAETGKRGLRAERVELSQLARNFILPVTSNPRDTFFSLSLSSLSLLSLVFLFAFLKRNRRNVLTSQRAVLQRPEWIRKFVISREGLYRGLFRVGAPGVDVTAISTLPRVTYYVQRYDLVRASYSAFPKVVDPPNRDR